MPETCTIQQVLEASKRWCDEHPGWQRICDIPDSDSLYKTWDELPKRIRAAWEKEYRGDAEAMWREYGQAVCKVPYGVVSGKGIFYESICDVPEFHNSMAVYKTGKGKNHGQINQRKYRTNRQKIRKDAV